MAEREHLAKVIYLPTPTLTPEQRESWQQDAAYWEILETVAQRHLEHIQRRREAALRMLGMIGTERGLDEQS